MLQNLLTFLRREDYPTNQGRGMAAASSKEPLSQATQDPAAYSGLKPTSKLDVIIVGAGIGGLAAAISIALSGHDVTVFESAKELLEARIQLTPNCTRILQRWGLTDRLWSAAAEPTALVVHRYPGQVLAQEVDMGRKMRARYGAPYLCMHRVDLQLALYDRARELGVRFRMGDRVDAVDFDLPALTTESGDRARADLLVAADGLWSRCRSSFLGTDDPPWPTGDLVYRVVLHLDQIDDPELRLWVTRPKVHFWIGPGSHAVGYSLRAGTMYNLVLAVPDTLAPGVKRQPGSVEEMRALFSGWDPILTRFLAMVDSVDRWKLMYRHELPSWISDKSNFVFVGDACHPMLPYLAQGAGSAIEDGAVLGLLLGCIRSKEQVPKALDMYEKLRKSRGEAIVRETFKQRESYHMADGPEQEARDQIFLSQLGKDQPEGPLPSRLICPEVQSWLYGYDAFEVVREAVMAKPFDDEHMAAAPGRDGCLYQ
ncbi:hypothetical protein ACO1O0_004471 [Amphichorda felina]